ncbi:MAG: hypothetical protein ACE5DI_01430, partial [Candidatus Micrarchaeia archaeon]
SSPSRGKLLKKVDAEKLAKKMKNGGATAISVLAEPAFFNGSLQNVLLAKKAGLPVLFKDFVYSNHQVIAAKKSGADCILLIYALFKKLHGKKAFEKIKEKTRFAHKLNLEVLLETHDEKEFKGALKTKADLIGINNRNLKTLKVDLSTTKKILSKHKTNKPIVSESGIFTREDTLATSRAGANAVLVGTSVLRSKNIEQKLEELTGKTSVNDLKIKICGITNAQDLQNASKAGATAIGLILTQSARKITLKQAQTLVKKAPAFLGTVAVGFPKNTNTLEMLGKTNAKYLQVHGNFSTPVKLKTIKNKYNVKVIKAITFNDIAKAKTFNDVADAFLLDAQIPGGGKTIDWKKAFHAVKKIKKPVVLAGGLNPENVKTAVRTVKPFGVDASTGIEQTKRRKSFKKMKAFATLALKAI